MSWTPVGLASSSGRGLETKDVRASATPSTFIVSAMGEFLREEMDNSMLELCGFPLRWKWAAEVLTRG